MFLDSLFSLLHTHRTYLILGRDSDSLKGSLGISQQSVVLEWQDEWAKRLRKWLRECE